MTNAGARVQRVRKQSHKDGLQKAEAPIPSERSVWGIQAMHKERVLHDAAEPKNCWNLELQAC